MLSSKIKKIVGFSFLVFFLTSLVLPFGIVLAQEKPTPTITLERYVNQQSSTNGFWRWGFTIETTDVIKGAEIWAWLYELQNGKYETVDGQTLVVTDNYAEYITPQILVPESTYAVKMLLVGTNISKQYGPEKIPEGGEVTVVGGGSSGGGSAPNINVQSLVCFPMNYSPNDQTPLEGKWWFKVLDNEYTATRFKGPYNDEDECKKSIQEIYYKPAPVQVNTKTDYYPLAPLPGVGDDCDEQCDSKGENCKTVCVRTGPNCTTTTDARGKTTTTCVPSNAFGKYLNMMIQIFIGLAAVLSMVMIVMGGIEYMTSELVSSKQAGKQRILNAVLGLLLALGSYAILNTLNPALLEVGLTNLPEATIEIGGDTEMPIGDISVLPSGIICSGGQSNIPNIAKSFKGKMTYEMGAKGIVGPSNTIKLDCSGFVNYVLKCAGMPFINGGTSGIFTNQEKVTSISENKVNGKELKLGDLVGWRAVDNTPKYKYGHVMIYIGNGQVQVADSHGGSSVGNALGIFPITNYQNDIKFIKRATTSMSGTSGTTTTETFSVSYNSGQKRFYFKGNFDHNIYTYTYTAYTEDVSVILLSNQPISKYNNSQPLKDDQYEKIKGKLLTIVVYNSGNKKVGAQKLQMPN